MDSRQKSIFWKAGGVALVIWSVLTIASIFAELWIGSRALVVSYQGKLYFPVIQGQISGRIFGMDYDYEADYRELQKVIDARVHGAETTENAPRKLQTEGTYTPETVLYMPAKTAEPACAHDFVILPLVPYNITENALATYAPDKFAPSPPNFEHRNFLGTDPLGRDILARLVYGYRNALIFAGLYLVGLMVIGTVLGLMFGYYGGAFDFWGQRIIEIWSNIPFIYVVMIVASITAPNLVWLVVLSLIFGWTGVAAFVRALVFREKTREFVLAAKATGASDWRIIVGHLLPQMGTMLLTFLPFQAVGAITTLTSLDFLGFGLRPPAASWGELLRTGSSSLQAPWIVSSVVVAMALVLILLTIIGNALREAFDPKTLLRYK